jgi:hypothetical protein
LLTCALVFGASLASATPVAAAPVQDPGATFGGGGVETTTTLAPATTSTTASDATNQTLVESAESPDQPLFTENRKVAAVIGGLVLVALALLLLTVRYVRVTKPVAKAPEEGLPMLPPTLELDDESVFVVADEDGAKPSTKVVANDAPVWSPPPAPAEPPVSAIAAASGTDHDAADDDWQPRTGEHERVEIPSGATLARPGVAARRKALGVDAS